MKSFTFKAQISQVVSKSATGCLYDGKKSSNRHTDLRVGISTTVESHHWAPLAIAMLFGCPVSHQHNPL